LTFAPAYFGHVNVGLLGLVPNLAVVAIGALVARGRRRTSRPEPVTSAVSGG